MRKQVELKHRSIQFWALVITTFVVGATQFDAKVTSIGLFIVLVVEYLAQAILHVERPLRELADFANENRKD